MITIDSIRNSIVPIPQKITAADGDALVLIPSSKFCLTAPEAEKGPIQTAGLDMTAFLRDHCGDDCFAPDGIPVTLSLGDAPEEVKNARDAYQIQVSSAGITITGFGDCGLYYGVSSFRQLCKWDSSGAVLPAFELLDWPDSPYRAYKQESRYGSNMMQREDWLAFFDDMAAKKINRVCLAMYSCWTVQYDGRVSEYLYLPIKKYPQLKTPMTVKYYSPEEDRWYNYETLPPIYRDDLLGELFRYAKDHAIDIVPGVNSFGHNTLFPNAIHAVSPKDEDGKPQLTGFCTSAEETYDLLFSIYDQIIDEYMLPNDMHDFNILLDEVGAGYGMNAEQKRTKLSPWCACPKCREKKKSEIFIDHAVKLVKHLKEKGMTTVVLANDMLVDNKKGGTATLQIESLGWIGDQLLEAVHRENLQDVLLIDWWGYNDIRECLSVTDCHPELGLRTICAPWNGYYIWCLLTNPMRNIHLMAELNHNTSTGQGLWLYAMWDKSYDRMHDCCADYAWNYCGSGSVDDVTERYVERHFGPMKEECLHAFSLMDWITEDRKDSMDDPLTRVFSYERLLRIHLSYYKFCYFNNGKPYPRHFPGEALERMVEMRRDYDRVLYSVASMAKEAVAIFKKAAVTPGCDCAMAERMAYECQNYVCLAEDWIALGKMYDLTQKGDQKKIAPMARARQNARLALMRQCEQVKEKFVVQAATMRNHSVFMQMFADIAAYIEQTDDPHLDLMDITSIMSKESWMLR